VGRVDVNRTNESRGLTDFMGTLHNIQEYYPFRMFDDETLGFILSNKLIKILGGL